MQSIITQLQQMFSDLADPDVDPAFHSHVSVLTVGNCLHVDFFGSPFERPFAELCAILARPDVATVLRSVSLRSPDTGANGTCNWDLSGFIDAANAFPSLQSFAVAQNAPGDHNRVIIAIDYAEDGVLGRLLHKAPMLDTLIVPSAPDASFFSSVHPMLRYLSVDAGYDRQHFIENLTNTTCFPRLQSLEFGEYNETYLEDFPKGCTPFEEYRRFFSAPHFATLRSFVWRNPVCSEAEIAELRSLKPARSLHVQIVSFSMRYV